MIRFRIFGIPVQVQPFFWLTMALIGGAIGANSATAILALGLFMLAGFISILVHELGHALTARRFGAWSEIILHAFGGVAVHNGPRMTRKQNFLIVAGGPFFQLALGLALLSLPYLFRDSYPQLSPYFRYFLGQLVLISIFWSLLNLLPVFPLDGGQILHTALGPSRVKVTLWVTFVVAVGGGISMFLLTNSLLFPIFLGIFAWRAWQGLQGKHLP